MDKLFEFLDMGGYAFFVWSSYSLTAVILLGIVFWTAQQFKRAQTNAHRSARQKRDDK